MPIAVKLDMKGRASRSMETRVRLKKIALQQEKSIFPVVSSIWVYLCN